MEERTEVQKNVNFVPPLKGDKTHKFHKMKSCNYND